MLFSQPAASSRMDTQPEEQKFDGVGRVLCADRQSPGTTYAATGWVLAGADTAVTAAHMFFSPPAPGQPQKTLDPRRCMFILYGPGQRVRGYAHIRYVLSPWSDPQLRYDSSHDVAVMKLDRAMPVMNLPPVDIFRGANRASVRLVAFQTGGADTRQIRITQGDLRPFPAGQLRYDRRSMRITAASHMFLTSAGSTAGSSGGMYFDQQSGAAIGLHIGWVCDTADGHSRYDPASCFNYGLRFDRETVALVSMVAHDGPAPRRLLVAAEDAGRLALAPAVRPTS